MRLCSRYGVPVLSLDNVRTWLAAGVLAVGIGSDLIREAVQTADLDWITQRATADVECVQGS
ncbi:beta/alpha barrel domain-containing protein [Alicyclobacillus mengziensis]|uniref:Uncharacterized protein n=1 Tax=Alicyclobacillus mengziensis TaxID=2931921 RepID=A0A9X7VZG3_9BACL|nr:hypothetical protein [Alicyclobacillus mengziensis]QSO47322.1 hypothetical protein JZ786_23535 [Alicyclobacillus mengziensis]